MKKVFSKGMVGSMLAVSLMGSVAITGTANAAKVGDGGTPLPAIDSVVNTIIDKSIINGSLAHDENGNLLYDNAGNARFVYTGKIYSVETDEATGELAKMSDDPIGDITGEAAFPKEFVTLSTAVNGLMQQMAAGTWNGVMPQMPAIVPWTCNHCDMTAGGTRYVSIVDVLDPNSPFYSVEMAAKFDAGLMPAMDATGNLILDSEGQPILGAAVAFDAMRMKGRAFTGLTPASFDPVARTMGVRMAGCSALVAIEGPLAGKVGTLCMNATAVFDVSGTKATGAYPNGMPIYDETSQITAEGSSNCVTVMHTPTM